MYSLLSALILYYFTDKSRSLREEAYELHASLLQTGWVAAAAGDYLVRRDSLILDALHVDERPNRYMRYKQDKPQRGYL